MGVSKARQQLLTLGPQSADLALVDGSLRRKLGCKRHDSWFSPTRSNPGCVSRVCTSGFVSRASHLAPRARLAASSASTGSSDLLNARPRTLVYVACGS